jgi:hypothetical protein
LTAPWGSEALAVVLALLRRSPGSGTTGVLDSATRQFIARAVEPALSAAAS